MKKRIIKALSTISVLSGLLSLLLSNTAFASYTIDTTYNKQRTYQRTANKYIILHETASPASGRNNAIYFDREYANVGAFTSFIVGDGGHVYQVAPTGFVQWGAGSYANANSPVQIELARTTDRATFYKDYNAYIELARDMAKKYGIPLTLDTPGNGIKSHRWVSDNIWGDHVDPWTYLASWGVTKEQVRRDLLHQQPAKPTVPAKPAKPTQPTIGWTAERATFTLWYGINLRTAPQYGSVMATLYPGQVVKYDAYKVIGNQVWVRQPRSNGYGYICVRQNGIPWGSFY